MKLADYKALLAQQRAQGLTPKGKPKAQIRLPKLIGPNQTEQALQRHLQQTEFKADYYVWKYEALSFRLPAGTLYTPDWCVWLANRLVAVIEVKGEHIHRGASLEKFKAARADNPHIPFRFFQLRDKTWTEA